jgi:hypothetical protein
VLVLFLLWRGRRNRTKRAAAQVTRTTGTFSRALLVGGVIVGVQWAVISRLPSTTTLLAVLGVPALFAGVAIARLLQVTETTVPKGCHR